jgi:predicted ester cyclase
MRIPAQGDAMNPTDAVVRNKSSYLQAKQAFNEGDLERCLGFYSPTHQIRSRSSPPGRDGIRAFFEQSRRTWPGLRLEVEHVVAEGEWVMGRSVTNASHTTTVFGVPPTGQAIQTAFWDLHRFDADGLIAESWNLLDGMSILGTLGLLPAQK